ncbi:hypothetical protein CDAR_297381 [Caerostris darwini]|uniref:Uncharacterized protein n=1 Tax=Caerostris darwini TaxID=1538125 RepID=A0AAV4PRW7_9ARAC|nr:hypothetical protein CDAR_297381 [Caerostris darwini]
MSIIMCPLSKKRVCKKGSIFMCPLSKKSVCKKGCPLSEKPAAMQHGRSSIVVPAPNPLHILLAVFLCCAFRTTSSFVRR